MRLTARQEQAMAVLAGPARHVMLFGGSRSGKTFVLVRAVIMRALKAARSRHAILRFRFNHLKASIIHDTFPKVMELCFPQVTYRLDKTDWFAEFANGSAVWFGGLDDKDRTEKILGQEYATIFLNECSQIPLASRDMALTRLAQQVMQRVGGCESVLRPRVYYDCNPPSKAHWSYIVFRLKEDPERRLPLQAGDYESLQMNPADNRDNLAPGYIEQTLERLPARLRRRFLEGEFGEANPNALWSDETIERWRVVGGVLPDLQRIVIGVDPSGSGEQDNAEHDEIGIVVAALGTDGIGYVLEDCSLKAGPLRWGAVAVGAYSRHAADVIVGEVHYGGAMVEHVIRTARESGARRANFKAVTASRGKVVRAEPISALYEQGKVRHVGEFRELEDEYLGFATTGYTGEGSPNRADAAIWALSELFPGLTREQERRERRQSYAVM